MDSFSHGPPLTLTPTLLFFWMVPCTARGALFRQLRLPRTGLGPLPCRIPSALNASNGAGWRAASTIPPPRLTPQQVYAARNRSLLMYTSAVILFTLGTSYAAVPLYRAFCSATGYNGTPMTGDNGRFSAERLVPITEGKSIKVHFNADKSAALPWKFTPQQKYVVVKPGETSLAFYKAKNTSDEDIIGIATYNVTPGKVAPYFSKVECFCFEEQKLLAGEEVDMPLLFFIDKDCLEDDNFKDVDDVVLSYTFFRARRNKQGHLEPDAPHDVVQASQGFEDFPSIDPSTKTT